MSDWQALYAAAFILVLAFGAPNLFVARVMAVNFLITMALGGDELSVAVLDLLCIAALVGQGPQARVVAALYILMVPIYIAGRANQWPADTTYAIIEALGYGQLMVMGNVGGGMGRRCRNTLRRHFGRSVSGIRGEVVSARAPVPARAANNSERHREAG